MAHEHHYQAHVTWKGSTAVGYADYSREHRLVVPPARTELMLSSDPAFRGDPELANPEQLLLGAASSCQLLSFLALVARAGIEVLSYEDSAQAVMPKDRITRIELRPHITVGSGVDVDEVLRLVHLAHEQCYIANSLNVEIDIEAIVEVQQ